MIRLLYNVLLTALIIITLPFALITLLVRPRYRIGLSQRLGMLPASILQLAQQAPPLWLHAPSVGELLATQPFLRALKIHFPDRPLLVSVQTTTAYQAARQRCPEADGVLYFPFDHPLVNLRVLRCIKPHMFFFTETEMWPNMLLSLARRHVPTFLVSGRFSVRAQQRYQMFAPLFQAVFRSIRVCCMQTHEDAQRLIGAGADARRVHVTGNFKADGPSPSDDTGKEILAQAGLDDRPLLIGASTHDSEEATLLQAARRLRHHIPSLLLLLAPRHPERFVVVGTLLQQGRYQYVKRSLVGDASSTLGTAETEVFLLDTLGELAGFYPSATLVFVGGSLIPGPGGHSVIEPALAGVPVCFGPHTRNFASIVTNLTNAHGGIEIFDAQSLYQAALPLFTDAQRQREAGARARQTIEQEQGAVERTMAVVRQHCSILTPHA